MKDLAGLERGRCRPCAARCVECCEYTYPAYPDEEDDEDDGWEFDRSPEEYRRRPLMRGLRERLVPGLCPPAPTVDPPCAGCGCPPEAHEVVEVGAAEAGPLDAARRIFAPLDLCTCIRQSVHDTTTLEIQRDDFLYGEVSELSFLRLLDRACHRRQGRIGGAFYDLGCGSGKAVVLAALHAAAGFRRCIGVELLPGLAAMAACLVERYRAEVPGDTAVLAECLCRDLFETDVSDASVVLLNAGSWREQAASRLRRYVLDALPHGCLIITMRKRLFDDSEAGMLLIEELALPMSWGVTPIFLQERRRLPSRRICLDELD